MTRTVAIALLVLLMLVTPARPAHAGFKSAIKKVGHVIENTVYVIAGVAAVVLVCKSGGCD